MNHFSPRRRSGRKAPSLALATVLSFSVVSACSSASSQEGEGEEPKNSITHLEPQAFNTLYPPAAGFYPNGAIVNNITARLLYQDPQTLELSPWIATELPEVNEDATVYTFNIRTDVTYSDGSELTAQNVVDNIDLFALGDSERMLTSSEQISYYSHGEVVDEDTVRFHFDQPAPGFAQATSSFNAGLLADSTLALGNEGFAPGSATQVHGAGPFYITEEEIGQKVVLTAREDYDWAPPAREHQGPARLDEIRYIVAEEASVRIGALVSGQADTARQIDAPEEALLEERGVNVVSQDTNGMVNQLIFRFRHPLLEDQRVRQAIIHGIDREEILHTLFSESYPRATSVMAEDALGYRKQPDEAYTYDPQEAERLLEEAGWTPGEDGVLVKDGQRLSLTIDEALPQPRSREVITKVQEHLARIGIEIHLNPGDQATQTAASRDIETIQIRHTMVARADYDVIKSMYQSEFRNEMLNYDSITDSLGDEHLESLLNAVAAAPGEQERAEIAGEIQDYITQNSYVLPLFEEPVVYGVQPYVEGFQPESIARPDFYEAYIKEGARD